MGKTDFDAIIIGGGPAGAAAGIHLSRAGLNTAIIERKTFPRETLCGEFLSKEVTESLRTLNLFGKFLELNPNKITSFRFITGNKIIESGLPFDGFSLKRSILDDFLLKEAAISGAKVFQPAEVKEVTMNQEYFSVQVNTGEKTSNLLSDFVIGAFGKSNILDKKLNRKFIRTRSPYNGIKFHLSKGLFSNLEDSCIYIFAGNNIYCGINTVSREEATVCFLDKKTGRKESPLINFEKLFQQNKNLSALLNHRMPDLKNSEIYGAGNIYFGRKELNKDGIIMIGDAAKLIAPLAGDGIGMALQSSKIISDIIMNYGRDKISISDIGRIYKTRWKENFTKRTSLALLIQHIILRNSFLNIIPVGIIRNLMPVIISGTRN